VKDDASTAARTGGTNLLTVLAHAGLPALHATITNLFGAAVYGLYAYALGVLEIVTYLATCGTEIGLLRFVALHRAAGDPAQENQAMGTALRVAFVLGAIFAALLAVLATPLAGLYDQPTLAPMLRWLSPGIPFAACSVVLITGTLAAKIGRMNLFVRGIGEPLLLLGLALVAAAVAPSALGLAGAHLAAAVLVCAGAAWAFSLVFGPGRLGAALRAPRHRELLRFSIPISGAELLNRVLQRADLLILLYFVGERALGLYAAAEFIGRAIGNARYAFDYVACPVLAEAHQEGDRARLAYNLGLMTRWVVLLALPLTTILVGFREEILGIFGAEFRQAATPLVILAAAHFVNAALGMPAWVVAMSGRARLTLVNALLGAIVNVGLNLWLIPDLGILGAAWAALFSVVFFRGLSLAQSAYLERVQPFTWGFAKALVAAGVALAVTLLARAALDPLPLLLVLVLGALKLLLYLGLLFTLGLAEEERHLLGKIPGLRWLRRERTTV
jgi:O-antigen/teichoic acid export membrane protein